MVFSCAVYGVPFVAEERLRFCLDAHILGSATGSSCHTGKGHNLEELV